MLASASPMATDSSRPCCDEAVLPLLGRQDDYCLPLDFERSRMVSDSSVRECVRKRQAYWRTSSKQLNESAHDQHM